VLIPRAQHTPRSVASHLVPTEQLHVENEFESCLACCRSLWTQMTMSEKYRR